MAFRIEFMSRRLTSDRFYGGVDNRVANLQRFLSYLRRRNPTLNEAAAWLESELGGASETTRDRYLSFLRGLDIVEQSGSHLHPGYAGARYLRSPDPEVLFAILDAGVAGFDLMLEALATSGPLTDEQLRQVLNAGPYGHDMNGPGVAIRHREWLQALQYAQRKRDSGGTRRAKLTTSGYELWKTYDDDLIVSPPFSSPEQTRADLPLQSVSDDPVPDSFQSERELTPESDSDTITYPAPTASQQAATVEHQEALAQLRDRLEAAGYEIRKTRYSDLIAFSAPDDRILIFEIKSITAENAWLQTRKAVGQVLEYEYTDIKQRDILSGEVQPGILLSQPPSRDVQEYLSHLTATRRIWVIWLANGLVGPSAETLRSYLDGNPASK